jgi:hypothetical protein
MFELILNTIKETLQKTKQEIILEVLRATSRDNAEIRCDLLELKQMLKAQSISAQSPIPQRTSPYLEHNKLLYRRQQK